MNQSANLANERWKKMHPLFRKLYLSKSSEEDELNERRICRHRIRHRQITRAS